MNADPRLMTDWAGPADEAFFAERHRRIVAANGHAPEPLAPPDEKAHRRRVPCAVGGREPVPVRALRQGGAKGGTRDRVHLLVNGGDAPPT